MLSSQMNLSADVNFDAISEHCQHFTGADLKALLYNSQLTAIHETSDLWRPQIGATDPLDPSTSSNSVDKILRGPFSDSNNGLTPDGINTLLSSSSTGAVSKEPSFEYLFPDNNNGLFPTKRERNNLSLSTDGSTGSDHSIGQSPSWEVVAMVTEKPKPERRVKPLDSVASVIHIPKLEDGPVDLEKDQEESLLSQVSFV